MWAIFRKCRICKKGGDLKMIVMEGSYGGWCGESYHYYHQECFDRVRNDPEKHSRIEVDGALEIMNCLDTIKRQNAKKREVLEGHIKRLKEYRETL